MSILAIYTRTTWLHNTAIGTPPKRSTQACHCHLERLFTLTNTSFRMSMYTGGPDKSLSYQEYVKYCNANKIVFHTGLINCPPWQAFLTTVYIHVNLNNTCRSRVLL